ncbi:MAG: ComEC/Rec2 family competence protein [Bacteroidales bacterium]|nr:ComEC/Rec2 family competence protein [Bacteroidales bacterium]
MLQRVLIIYILGILLCDFLFSQGPWEKGESQRQDVAVSVGLPYAQKVKERCAALLCDAGLDSLTVVVAQGVLFGDKKAMPKEQKQLLSRAGMSHILAVSGLHIGIIWAMLAALFLPFRMFDERGWHRWIILLLLWGYIAVVGFPISAIRAGTMITMVHVSYFLRRDVWSWDNLSAAALLILLFLPSQLYEVGFQLSFLSTAGILSVSPWLTERCPELKSTKTGEWSRPWWLWLLWQIRGLIIVTLSAQLLTFPLVAYYFHQVPLFGWIQGVLVVPFMTLFVLALFVVLLLSCFGISVALLTSLANGFCSWMNAVAKMTVDIEEYCLGGTLSWYPSLLDTLLLLSAVSAVAWLMVNVKMKSK